MKKRKMIIVRFGEIRAGRISDLRILKQNKHRFEKRGRLKNKLMLEIEKKNINSTPSLSPFPCSSCSFEVKTVCQSS